MSQHISKKSSFHRGNKKILNKDDISVIINQEAFSTPTLNQPIKSYSFLMTGSHLSTKRTSSSSNQPMGSLSSQLNYNNNSINTNTLSNNSKILSRHHSTSGSFVRRNQLKNKTSLILIYYHISIYIYLFRRD
jgi:hypothetical protein